MSLGRISPASSFPRRYSRALPAAAHATLRRATWFYRAAPDFRATSIRGWPYRTSTHRSSSNARWPCHSIPSPDGNRPARLRGQPLSRQALLLHRGGFTPSAAIDRRVGRGGRGAVTEALAGSAQNRADLLTSKTSDHRHVYRNHRPRPRHTSPSSPYTHELLAMRWPFGFPSSPTSTRPTRRDRRVGLLSLSRAGDLHHRFPRASADGERPSRPPDHQAFSAQRKSATPRPVVSTPRTVGLTAWTPFSAPAEGSHFSSRIGLLCHA